MKKIRVGVIGCGNMGYALVRRIAAAKSLFVVTVSDVDRKKAAIVARKCGAKVALDNCALAVSSDIIILAVKPREIGPVAAELAPCLKLSVLVISIAAGLSTKSIERYTGRVAVVRAMPNMPAIIGKGITVICRGSRATARHSALARRVLEAVGPVVEVRESWMHAVTALSGSGPAYFFFMVECMMEAARELGLPEKIAHRLISETAHGSGALLAGTAETAKALRARVTSKKGTTEAAFRVIEAGDLKETFIKAIKAAARRSRELEGQ